MWKKIKNIVIQAFLCFLCSFFCFYSWSMDAVIETRVENCAVRLVNNDNIPDHFVEKLKQFFTALLKTKSSDLKETISIKVVLKLLPRETESESSLNILNLDLSNSYIISAERYDLPLRELPVSIGRSPRSRHSFSKDKVSFREIFQSNEFGWLYRPQLNPIIRIAVISIFLQNYIQYISSLSRAERRKHFEQLTDDLEPQLGDLPEDVFNIFFEKGRGERRYLAVSNIFIRFEDEILDMPDIRYRNTAYVLNRSIDGPIFLLPIPQFIFRSH